MRLTIESTPHIVPDMGRLWLGKTESGHDVFVIVAGVGAEPGSEADKALGLELVALQDLGTDGIYALTEIGQSLKS